MGEDRDRILRGRRGVQRLFELLLPFDDGSHAGHRARVDHESRKRNYTDVRSRQAAGSSKVTAGNHSSRRTWHVAFGTVPSAASAADATLQDSLAASGSVSPVTQNSTSANVP